MAPITNTENTGGWRCFRGHAGEKVAQITDKKSRPQRQAPESVEIPGDFFGGVKLGLCEEWQGGKVAQITDKKPEPQRQAPEPAKIPGDFFWWGEVGFTEERQGGKSASVPF